MYISCSKRSVFTWAGGIETKTKTWTSLLGQDAIFAGAQPPPHIIPFGETTTGSSAASTIADIASLARRHQQPRTGSLPATLWLRGAVVTVAGRWWRLMKGGIFGRSCKGLVPTKIHLQCEGGSETFAYRVSWIESFNSGELILATLGRGSGTFYSVWFILVRETWKLVEC